MLQTIIFSLFGEIQLNYLSNLNLGAGDVFGDPKALVVSFFINRNAHSLCSFSSVQKKNFGSPIKLKVADMAAGILENKQ